MLDIPKIVDPDKDDTVLTKEIDFGSAKSFVNGKFPKYIVEPLSNDTDPGIYEVIVKLADDNP